MDSLREMEIQCKERVDLLDALRRSRLEAKKEKESSTDDETVRGRRPPSARTPGENVDREKAGYIGQGTVRALNYPDLSRRPPPLPQRPAVPRRKSTESQNSRSQSAPYASIPGQSTPLPAPTVPVPAKTTSRTSSPDRKGRMLTTLRPGKDGKRPSKSPRASGGRRGGPPAASKAAGLAWGTLSRSTGNMFGQSLVDQGGSTATVNSLHRDTFSGKSKAGLDHVNASDADTGPSRSNSIPGTSSSPEARSLHDEPQPTDSPTTLLDRREVSPKHSIDARTQSAQSPTLLKPPIPPPHAVEVKKTDLKKNKPRPSEPLIKPPVDYLSYRSEYPAAGSSSRVPASPGIARTPDLNDPLQSYSSPRQRSPLRKPLPAVPPGKLSRRPVANNSTPRGSRPRVPEKHISTSSASGDEKTSSGHDDHPKPLRNLRKKRVEPLLADALKPTAPAPTPKGSSKSSVNTDPWDERVEYLTKHLPKGVDENAAQQIFNEIVVKGDEVHWDDVAGLEIAKKALKEAVVYPFLRPDLFMGLREPARGMLLFGPPGTGKTMLARAVATESRSTFFAISASSLTSKYLGESEKLVRALFALAKALAPSIIFVDEIDSLLSSRGGSSEHESTRRIKTEFLIQWSDLQRAAAGKEQTEKEKREGDASRVLVLAATNMPWAIDEAARRRFVRRQYIPLPEAQVRALQLRTLLSHQKHSLTEQDIEVLVRLTDGMSDSFYSSLFLNLLTLSFNPHSIPPSLRLLFLSPYARTIDPH